MKAFSETERQEFLAARHVGVLSVAAHDGRPPSSVPIWYGYAPGGNILVNTGSSSRKAKLIERAGAVTLVVQLEEPPYQYVVIEGTETGGDRVADRVAAMVAVRLESKGHPIAATGIATRAPTSPSRVPPIRVAMMVSPGVTLTVCFMTRGLTR